MLNLQSAQQGTVPDEGPVDALTEKDRAELDEKIRQFNLKLKLERDKLSAQKEKNRTDAELKRKQLNKPKTNPK